MKRLNEAISSIKNGLTVGASSVRVYNSSFIRNVLKVLQQNGYLGSFVEAEDSKYLHVNLVYYKGKPVVRYFKMLSTCGSRIYAGKLTAIPRNFGVRVLSTNQGVMSHMEATKRGIGGQLLLEVF
jgi:small subunit ribosomal protein S8